MKDAEYLKLKRETERAYNEYEIFYRHAWDVISKLDAHRMEVQDRFEKHAKALGYCFRCGSVLDSCKCGPGMAMEGVKG